MLYWIAIAVFVVALIPLIKYWDNYSLPKWVYPVTWGSVIIGGFATVIMTIVLLVNWIGIDGSVSSWHVQQKSLEARYEQAQWPNRESIAKDIEEWNTDLAWNQAMQDNFWFDPLIPDVYEQFDLIDISKNGGREK